MATFGPVPALFGTIHFPKRQSIELLEANLKGVTDTLRLLGAAAFISAATITAHSITDAHIAEETAANCQPLEVSVYFRPGDAQLNEYSESVLNRAMGQVQHCNIGQIQIFGYADASGSSSANLEISRLRAENALEYLNTLGLAAEDVIVEARGEEGALTPDGQREVMRRKADLRFIPKQGSV